MNQTEILKYLEGQKTTRTITDLIVHCTATKPGAKVNVDVIDGWHKERGFKKSTYPQFGKIRRRRGVHNLSPIPRYY